MSLTITDTNVVASCDTCGFNRTYDSQPRADYALRKHSCEKQLAKTAAAQRRDNVDRTPKPCQHKRALHLHGTHAAYVLDRCRCRPCADANSAYEGQRARLTAYGQWQPFVNATPAREHVRALMAAGVGLKRITTLTGIGGGVLCKLVYGHRRPDGSMRPPTERMRRYTAERILAVTAADAAEGAYVPSIGSARRLQALVANGWSMSKLARRLGVDPSNFTRLAHGEGNVTAGRARAVAALYDELWDQAPPEATKHDRQAASRARNYAGRRGWVPPLAWDDDTIDKPSARPDTGEKTRRSEALLEDVAELQAQGYSLDTIAGRLGVTRSAIEKARSRAGKDVAA